MTFTDGKTNETRKTEVSKFVSEFFDVNGVLCPDLYSPVVEKMRESLTSEKKSNWLLAPPWRRQIIIWNLTCVVLSCLGLGFDSCWCHCCSYLLSLSTGLCVWLGTWCKCLLSDFNDKSKYNKCKWKNLTLWQRLLFAFFASFFFFLVFVCKVVSDSKPLLCVTVCVTVCVCVCLASNSSETVEVIVKLCTVTPSDMGMHHTLIILTLTFIQGHTYLNHENNKCLIIKKHSSNVHQVCCGDGPTKGLSISIASLHDLDLHSSSQVHLKLDWRQTYQDCLLSATKL